MVDCCWGKLVNVSSAVPQGSVLYQSLFLMYNSQRFSILQNKLYNYIDKFTLLAVVPSQALALQLHSPGTVTQAWLVGEWCDL